MLFIPLASICFSPDTPLQHFDTVKDFPADMRILKLKQSPAFSDNSFGAAGNPAVYAQIMTTVRFFIDPCHLNKIHTSKTGAVIVIQLHSNHSGNTSSHTS